MSLVCCTALPWATLPAGCSSGGQSPRPRTAPATGVQLWDNQLQPCLLQRVCPDPASGGFAELCYGLELHLELQRKPRRARSSHPPALLKRQTCHLENFEIVRFAVTIDWKQSSIGFLSMAWTGDGIGSLAGQSIHPSSDTS